MAHVIHVVVPKNRFFSNISYLLKTARNCLSSSDNGKSTCYMLNSGMLLLWNHIADIFYEVKNVDFIYFQNYAQSKLN